jgi:hypothetical protein
VREGQPIGLSTSEDLFRSAGLATRKRIQRPNDLAEREDEVGPVDRMARSGITIAGDVLVNIPPVT